MYPETKLLTYYEPNKKKSTLRGALPILMSRLPVNRSSAILEQNGSDVTFVTSVFRFYSKEKNGSM